MILTTGKKKGFVIEGSSHELFRASHLPGAVHRHSEGVVRLPENLASWRALRAIEFDSICPGAVIKLDTLKADYREHRRQIRLAARRFKLTGETEIPVPLKTVPYSHQVRAFGFASSIPEAALFMDQGTGKTMVGIAVAGKRYQDNVVQRVLVICPKAVKPVWPRELNKHAKFDWCASQDKPPEGEGVQFWVTNYDRVKRELRRLKKWKPDLIILDESHRVKNRKATRTSAVITLGAKVPYKLILTGTPMGKCISETWSQYKFLNNSIFGSNFSQFKEQYLKMGGYMGYQVVGYKNEDEFADKLHSVAFRVTKDECLDLPPMNYQRLYVTPDAKTKRIYKDLDLDLFSEVDGEEITVDREATKQMKLRQIVGGLVRTDNQEVAHVSNLKMSTLREFMEDRLDKKTVIFFSFTHEIELAKKMCKDLKLGFLTLQGSTKDEDRDKFEDRFQEDPSIGVALIQVQTGAEGMTLTAADVAIFYSPTFSFMGYSQARDRIYRIGQTLSVTVVFIIMEKTVDERVVDVLECNGQLTDTYLESKRNYSVGETKMAKVTEGYKASDLAGEFEITPADLRKHLRALKIEKPEAGWVWPKKTDKGLVEIRKQLKARLKDLASKATAEKKEPAEKAPAKKAAAKKSTDSEEGNAPAKKTRSRKAKKTSDDE